MSLTRSGWLSADEALAYTRQFEPRLSMEDPRMGMDLDPVPLSYGSPAKPGALLLAGGRVGTFVTPYEGAGSVFVEGDLHVDGCLISYGHLLITGNLTARDVFAQQYLVVLGNLEATRFLGLDDGFGTRVLGDLIAEDVIECGNHHLSLFGEMRCTTHVDEEQDGAEDVNEVFERWGVPPAERPNIAGALAVFRGH